MGALEWDRWEGPFCKFGRGWPVGLQNVSDHEGTDGVLSMNLFVA